MAMSRPLARRQYRCSFCGKPQDEVSRLIAGPGGVHICDQCVELCRETFEEETPPPSQGRPDLADPAVLSAQLTTLNRLVGSIEHVKQYPKIHPATALQKLIETTAEVAGGMADYCRSMLAQEAAGLKTKGEKASDQVQQDTSQT